MKRKARSEARAQRNARVARAARAKRAKGAPPRSGHDFSQVFERLREILAAHAPELVVTRDAPGDYALDTRAQLRGRPVFFGGVRTMRRYVSFHLMPVYGYAGLADAMSPALRARMQGKACFNFTTVDDALFAELAAVARLGLEAFRAQGLLGA